MSERNFQEEALRQQERINNIIVDAIIETARIDEISRWEKSVEVERTRDIEW